MIKLRPYSLMNEFNSPGRGNIIYFETSTEIFKIVTRKLNSADYKKNSNAEERALRESSSLPRPNLNSVKLMSNWSISVIKMS